MYNNISVSQQRGHNLDPSPDWDGTGCVIGRQLQWDWTHLCRWTASSQTFVAGPTFEFVENPPWIRGKRNLVEEADCIAFIPLSVTRRIFGRPGLELSCKDLGCVISQPPVIISHFGQESEFNYDGVRNGWKSHKFMDSGPMYGWHSITEEEEDICHLEIHEETLDWRAI